METEKSPIITKNDDEIPNVEIIEPDLSHIHPCCNPQRSYHRFIFLIFLSFLGFGSYFVYDNPVALQEHFLDDLKISMTQYSFLYGVYSYPNTVLCFFGGFLVDRVFGLRWGAIIFTALILVGQIVFAFGTYIDAFWLVLVGRFIFGLGGESLIVAQNCYAVDWFIGKELNMVLGLQVSFSRVGSTANMNIMGPVYNAIKAGGDLTGYKLLGAALFVATLTCMLSFLCAVICGILDKRAKKLLAKSDGSADEKINFSDIKSFPLTFWMISLVCVAYYVAVFPFISLGELYFERKWDMTNQSAEFIIGFPYIVAAIGCPIFGILIDKTGRNLLWVLSAVFITLAAHLIMTFTFASSFIGMTILGIGYSVLACSLWPLVAYVIPEHQLGTAYGAMQSIQNIGLAVVPTILGVMIDKRGFMQSELICIIFLALTLFAVVFLYLSDIRKGGILNRSAKKRALLEEKQD